MIIQLVALLISFFVTLGLSVPFIHLLYQLKFRTTITRSEDMFGKKTIFNQLHGHKVGTPTGAGILLIVILFFITTAYHLLLKIHFNGTYLSLIATALLFGGLGFYDDIKKFFRFDKKGFFGLRVRHKFILQILASVVVFWFLFTQAGVGEYFSFPLLGTVSLSRWGLLLVVLLLMFFNNAFNITDGLDGLSGGLMLIALLPFWYLAVVVNGNTEAALFISVILGSLLAFLYFNVNPARFFMGDAGALALGALLAVFAVLLNQIIPLFIIGGVMVVEALSSLLQWGSMLLRDGKRIFKIAPIHHHFEALGWEETKITTRFWLVGVLCAFVGLLLALLMC